MTSDLDPNVSRALRHLLDPWTTIGVSHQLVEELGREVAADHPLHGVRAEALARRMDNDDVLFAVIDGPGPFVVVHLTWSRAPEPGWPPFRVYATIEDWEHGCMDRDHDDWASNKP